VQLLTESLLHPTRLRPVLAAATADERWRTFDARLIVTARSAAGMMAGQDFGDVDAEVVRLAGAGLDALEVA
jgi:hypothetical protein